MNGHDSEFQSRCSVVKKNNSQVIKIYVNSFCSMCDRPTDKINCVVNSKLLQMQVEPITFVDFKKSNKKPYLKGK